MAALDPAHITPGAELFLAETGGVGGVIDRQLARFENLVGVEAGNRHFCRRHQPQTRLFIAVEVVTEFGQLAGGPQHRFFNYKRRVDLLVALLQMEIEQPLDDGPLQARAGAAHDIKARTGQLDAALEVENAQRLTQFPVRAGGEGQLPRFTLLVDDHVIVFINPIGHIRVRQIANLKHRGPLLLFDLGQLAIKRRDFIAELAHRLDLSLSLGSVFHSADLLRDGVAFGFARLNLVDQTAALLVEGQHLIDNCAINTAAGQLALHFVGLLADKFNVKHGFLPYAMRKCAAVRAVVAIIPRCERLYPLEMRCLRQTAGDAGSNRLSFLRSL
nr:hypothetical protein [Chloroflexus islandicus]